MGKLISVDRACVEVMTLDALAAIRNEDAQIIRVLSDNERRHVLDLLETSDASIALADLAIEMARRETDVEGDSVFELAKEIRLRLHHCHLPKLDEVGLIDYDVEQNLVALPDDPEIVASSKSVEPLRS